jgi:hypothetical protein
MRIDLEPGIYSDWHEIDWVDVNCPVRFGFSYLVNPDLQWFFGVSADPRRSWPVIPGVGVRWKFAEQWTLMALMPEPKIQWEPIKDLTLYLGAELKGGTYRVARDFGNSSGLPRLNNASLEYSEVRTGGGLDWRAMPFLNVGLEVGAAVYRRFDYPNADHVIHAQPAPYVQLGVKASF